MTGRMFLWLWWVAALAPGLLPAEPPPVRVVYIADAPPTSWEEGGQPRGYEPDIVGACLAKLGLKASQQFLPWARAQLMVESGEADLMVTTPTAERFRYGIFGREKAVLKEFNLFLRKTDEPLAEKARGFTRLEDLKPYTIGDYLGDGWTATYLKPADGYRILETYQADQLPQLLASGRADFCLNDPELIHKAMATSGLTGKITELKVPLPHTRFHYVFIVSRKSPWALKGLVKGLDGALADLKSSGGWAKILKKYDVDLGDENDFPEQIDTGPFYDGYSRYPVFQGGTP